MMSLLQSAFIVVVAFFILCFLSLHFASLNSHQHNAKEFRCETNRPLQQRELTKEERSLLLELIEAQNRTIYILEQQLKKSKNHVVSGDQSGVLASSVENIQGTLDKIQGSSRTQQNAVTPVVETKIPERCLPGTYNATVTNTYYNGVEPRHRLELEEDCEKRYGLELASKWKSSKEIWCEHPTSQLICYPYHQEHKRRDGRGADLVCEATNFVIDFSKIDGEPFIGHKKPPKGSEYLSFQGGSLLSPCRPTPQLKSRLYMSHHGRQMRTFSNRATVVPDGTVDTPTYLLARDEDCENSFHSTADFMNMLLVSHILDVNVSQQQVMLFDRFSDGPYIELIQKGYSPNHPVIRHTHYQRRKVLFKHLIFHLESPAGLIFPKVSRPDPMRCYRESLFEAYRRFVLHSFGLLHVPPPVIPSVTLTLRHRSEHKNVGRVMGNEKEVVEILRKGNMIDLKVSDFASIPFSEQLKQVRNTNVLIGVHGAGLMLIMFAAEEAVLVEVHPSYRQDRHFRHAARMTGKIYMPVRAIQRETCVGTSDTVMVPLGDFRSAVDGALRLARNFDDGLSECGLVCPAEIIAIDGRLDPYYKGTRKGKSLNMAFPC
jgi:hypothetical protein